LENKKEGENKYLGDIADNKISIRIKHPTKRPSTNISPQFNFSILLDFHNSLGGEAKQAALFVESHGL
jgi:hypothetical protein